MKAPLPLPLLLLFAIWTAPSEMHAQGPQTFAVSMVHTLKVKDE